MPCEARRLRWTGETADRRLIVCPQGRVQIKIESDNDGQGATSDGWKPTNCSRSSPAWSGGLVALAMLLVLGGYLIVTRLQPACETADQMC